jgi:hypothetical protein
MVLLPLRVTSSLCNMRQLLLLPNKKRRATAAFTHVSPPSVVVGSAERHANAVLSASTAAVNHLLSNNHFSLAFKRMDTRRCIIVLFVTLLPYYFLLPS